MTDAIVMLTLAALAGLASAAVLHLQKALASARAETATLKAHIDHLVVEKAAGEDTRKILSMLSDQIRVTGDAVEAVGVMKQQATGLVSYVQGLLEKHASDSIRTLERASDKAESHLLVVDSLRQQVAWLQRAMAAEMSFDRAQSDLKAEQLVREAENQNDAIQADAATLAPFIGRQQPGYKGPRFATVRRSRRRDNTDQNLDERSLADVPEPATVGGPVPSDEHLGI